MSSCSSPDFTWFVLWTAAPKATFPNSAVVLVSHCNYLPCAFPCCTLVPNLFFNFQPFQALNFPTLFEPFLVQEPLEPIGDLSKAKNQGEPACPTGIASSRSPWQHGFSTLLYFFEVEKRFARFFLYFAHFGLLGPRL